LHLLSFCSADGSISLKLFYDDQELMVKVPTLTRVQELVDICAQKFGKCLEDVRAIGPDCDKSSPTARIGSCGLQNGDHIVLLKAQIGGKPVIYLYSPSDIDASVKHTLSPKWQFSAIYPVVPTKTNRGEGVEWNVQTHQDGSLTEKNTGQDVSYLFWEAE
jgi:hypothetical protein